ncbi:MraY family glycosyltransferase [Algibacter mikhailovii]|nr:MraY family glycosyltransferase [Algibacter mikhailovii]
MSEAILSNLPFVSLLIVVCSFSLVYYLIPKIIFMVNHHDLNEIPGERSAHVKATPTMGGLAFFVVLMVNMFLLKHMDLEQMGLNLTAALTLIFVIGLKDDLAVSTPRARLLIEILALFIILMHPTYHSTSFDGFLGFKQVPTWLLDGIHIIIALTIINAYNLIDGVDGLASALGISMFSMLGFVFFSMGLNFYWLLCLGLIFMLLAFMRYNFSHWQKIFMGDTGSLIIGFCIAVLSLKFLTIETTAFSEFRFKIENRLFIIAAIVVVPLFDMLRVIGIRLLNRQSPFIADRNHIHHVLLDLGWAHYKIALLLGVLNYSLAIGIIFLSVHFNSFQMTLALLVILVLFFMIFHRLKLRSLKKHELKTL